MQMLDRAHPISILLMLVLAAGTLIACDGGRGTGPADSATAGERFSFVRVQSNLFRIDSSTGEVWVVPSSGDGGWAAFGQAPESDQSPNRIGRYGLHTLASRRRQQDGEPPQLLRSDRDAGRAWVADSTTGSQWLQIADSRGDSRTPQPAPTRPAATQTPPPTAPTGEPQLNVIPRDVLGKTPEETAKEVDIIVRALSKEGMPVEIKVWAARQLGVFDKEVAVPPLVEALESEHPEVVVAAIKSLSQIGAVNTIPKILNLKGHPDANVRAAVDEVVIEVR